MNSILVFKMIWLNTSLVLYLVWQEALEKLKLVNWPFKREFRLLNLIKLPVLSIYNLVPKNIFISFMVATLNLNFVLQLVIL